MKRVLVILACLALVPFAACGLLSMSTCGVWGARKAIAESRDAAVAIAAAPAMPSDTGAPAQPEETSPDPMILSLATFSKEDLLDYCGDFVVPIPDGGISDQKWAEFRSAMKKAQKGAQFLRKKCAEQFRERAPLARCDTQFPIGDAGLSMGAHDFYFNIESLSNDSYMKACLAQGGDWTASAHDSPEWLEAKHDDARRRIEKLSGQR